MLLYLSRSYIEYKAKVKHLVSRLRAVGLLLDVGKSKFSLKTTKYLEFIIKAKKGIYIDLDKVTAIKI